MSNSYSHYYYDYDPVHKYEKYKHVPTSFSYDFFKQYSKYFKPYDPRYGSTISHAIDSIHLPNNKKYTKDVTYKIQPFIQKYLNFNEEQYDNKEHLKIGRKIIEAIQYANSQKKWNKCWKESESIFEKCPNKSMISRISRVFSRSSNKGGIKRKNNRKTKKYRNKFL
jgi:hypothetical protein